MRFPGAWVPLVLSGLILGCGEDPPSAPGGGPGEVVLHYDAENESAPHLAAGRHEGAVFFSTLIMRKFESRLLDRVQFHIRARPENCQVRVYTEGGTGFPGALLYQADVTDAIVGESWNEHTLDPPVVLDGKAIWISIAFRNEIQQGTLGCDPGPAIPHGDWYFDSDDQEWEPLRLSGPSINWNLRGVLAAEE